MYFNINIETKIRNCKGNKNWRAKTTFSPRLIKQLGLKGEIFLAARQKRPLVTGTKGVTFNPGSKYQLGLKVPLVPIVDTARD